MLGCSRFHNLSSPIKLQLLILEQKKREAMTKPTGISLTVFYYYYSCYWLSKGVGWSHPSSEPSTWKPLKLLQKTRCSWFIGISLNKFFVNNMPRQNSLFYKTVNMQSLQESLLFYKTETQRGEATFCGALKFRFQPLLVVPFNICASEFQDSPYYHRFIF